jgi:hypothetical protein
MSTIETVDYNKTELKSYIVYEMYKKKCIDSKVRYSTLEEFTLINTEIIMDILNKYLNKEVVSPTLFSPYATNINDIWCCIFNNNGHIDYLIGTKEELIKEIEQNFTKKNNDFDNFIDTL